MLELVLVLNIFALVAIAVVVVMKYRLTKDRGLLMLLIALVAWPVCVMVLDGVTRFFLLLLAAGEPVVFPFTLVQTGQLSFASLAALLRGLAQFVSSTFVLIGVWMLYRSGKCAQLLQEGSPRPGAVQPTG